MSATQREKINMMNMNNLDSASLTVADQLWRKREEAVDQAKGR